MLPQVDKILWLKRGNIYHWKLRAWKASEHQIYDAKHFSGGHVSNEDIMLLKNMAWLEEVLKTWDSGLRLFLPATEPCKW